jgi:protein-disulfide isomerase
VGGATAPFPQANLAGLDAAGLALFSALADEEFCPCDCPVTLAACLQEGVDCPAAPLVAQVLARDIRDGASPEDLRRQAAEAFSGGYSAPPRPMTLTGYASLGPAGAPVTLVVYSDFQCPHCRLASAGLKEVVKEHPGEVRVVFKHFPLMGHSASKDAAVAAEAAGRQGRFWEMHDLLFEHQASLNRQTIRGLARQVGLDMKRFDADLTDPSLAGRVEASRKEAEALGISSTPTVFVNGRAFGLRRTKENYHSRIAMERVRGQGRCP